MSSANPTLVHALRGGIVESSHRGAVAIEAYALRGWYDLGVFLAGQGRYPEARSAFERGAVLAEEARTFVPLSAAERELIALGPSVFYNEMRRMEAIEQPGGTAS